MQSNSQFGLENLYQLIVSFAYVVYHIQPNGRLRPISETSLISGNWLAQPVLN